MTELEFAQAALDTAHKRYLAADAKATSLQMGSTSSRMHQSHELAELTAEVDKWQKRVNTLKGAGRCITHTTAVFPSRRRCH